MGARPPFETFTGATCKGCYALGSACGNCERCAWERAEMEKENLMQPTIGRILIYKLSSQDLQRINARVTGERNPHSVGQELPLIVCCVWPHEFGTDKPGVNGQLFLDGERSLWLTSVGEGDGEGQWHWPVKA